MPEVRRAEHEKLLAGGYKALAIMETRLAHKPYLVGTGLTIADISLYGYTHVAEEGGFDLSGYPALLPGWREGRRSGDRIPHPPAIRCAHKTPDHKIPPQCGVATLRPIPRRTVPSHAPARRSAAFRKRGRVALGVARAGLTLPGTPCGGIPDCQGGSYAPKKNFAATWL